MDQGAACPAIAIDKRMNRFELCMRHCRLRDGRKLVVITEFAKVLEQATHIFGWRRNECS
jgi:hypothetical protein